MDVQHFPVAADDHGASVGIARWANPRLRTPPQAGPSFVRVAVASACAAFSSTRRLPCTTCPSASAHCAISRVFSRCSARRPARHADLRRCVTLQEFAEGCILKPVSSLSPKGFMLALSGLSFSSVRAARPLRREWRLWRDPGAAWLYLAQFWVIADRTAPARPLSPITDSPAASLSSLRISFHFPNL